MRGEGTGSRNAATGDREKKFMALAIELAATGMERGDGGPFGAVIVRGREVIGRGWNRVLASNDPTAHAEIVAIRDACDRTGSYWLDGCHIFVNCEPCPMCLAAIHWARLASLTFAATRDDAAAIGFDDARIYRQVCLPPERRQLPTHQRERQAALRVMQQWPALAHDRMY